MTDSADSYGDHATEPELPYTGADAELGYVEVLTASDEPTTVGGVLQDLLDKAVKTFAQTLLVYLGAGATVTVLDVPWSVALQGAVIATVFTVAIALAQSAWSSTNAYIDALARAARTFLVSFAGALPVVDAQHAATFSDIAWGQAAGIAGTLAVVSLLTSVASMQIGSRTPSLVR